MPTISSPSALDNAGALGSLERGLPEGWAAATLADLVEILDSRRVPVNAKEREHRVGRIPYYGATGQVGTIDGYLFDEELVLLGEDGAPFLDGAKRKAYVIRGKSWVNNHAHVLRARPCVNCLFLMHELNVVDFRPWVSGTTRLKLPQAPMRQIPLRVAPLSEQKRIVEAVEARFTRVEAAVAALERVRAKLKQYRASVLRAACEGRLAGLGLSPTKWTNGQLGGVLDSIKNGIYRPPNVYSEDGVTCLRMYNIYEGRLLMVDLKHMRLTPAEIDEYELRPGDVLVNRVNSRGIVGKAACVPDNLGLLVYESKNMRLRFKDGVHPQFATYWLNAIGIPHFARNSQQVVGMASINQPQVRDLPFRLPPPDEQCRIVAEVERRLSVTDEITTEVDMGLRRCSRLRSSILRRAFDGRLVPQNPNDEPAHALLARISSQPQVIESPHPRRLRRPAAPAS